MFFCGYSEDCKRHNSQWALSEAVRNVEKWFDVVGVLEEFDKSLMVLDHVIPEFFAGVRDMGESECRRKCQKDMKNGILQFLKSEKLHLKHYVHFAIFFDP